MLNFSSMGPFVFSHWYIHVDRYGYLYILQCSRCKLPSLMCMNMPNAVPNTLHYTHKYAMFLEVLRLFTCPLYECQVQHYFIRKWCILVFLIKMLVCVVLASTLFSWCIIALKILMLVVYLLTCKFIIFFNFMIIPTS